MNSSRPCISMETITTYLQHYKIQKHQIKIMNSGNFHHRIRKELVHIQTLNDKLKNVQIEESDMHIWYGMIHPENPPYNKGAFRVKIVFPREYPFKPPVINFMTKIFHPNIDEHGSVCLSIVNSEVWKPATRFTSVLDALVKLIDEPEPEHPLRTDIAELFLKDQKGFIKAAEEFTRKNSENQNNTNAAHCSSSML